MNSNGLPLTAIACIWPVFAHLLDDPYDSDDAGGGDCDGLPRAPTVRPFEEALDEIVRMCPWWPVGVTPDARRTHREAWAEVLRERYDLHGVACCSDPTR